MEPDPRDDVASLKEEIARLTVQLRLTQQALAFERARNPGRRVAVGSDLPRRSVRSRCGAFLVGMLAGHGRG
jgi:hypothetical protein